jgi:hypothetical protein
MSSTHACALCDYTRTSEHVAVLDPTCPVCGGHLGPVSARAQETSAPRIVALARRRWVERSLVAIVVLPLVAAAAKVGWSSAGPAAGIGALALATLIAYVALAPATRHM